jgi:hypothetical protein
MFRENERVVHPMMEQYLIVEMKMKRKKMIKNKKMDHQFVKYFQFSNSRFSIFSLLAESKTNNEVKPSSQDNEPEAGEVPDAPRPLHRTSSIFFRHLAMQTTKDDLENVKFHLKISPKIFSFI